MDLKTKLLEQIEAGKSNIVNNEIVQSIIQRTFLWTGGITFIVFTIGYYMVSLIKTGAINATQYQIAFWASAILGIGLIIAISWFYSKMNYLTLAVLTILFGILEGVGLAGVLSMYNAASVINAFAGAAVLFIILAIYGYTTKTDLTKMGSLLLVGLIAVIILSLINIFLIHSSQLEMIISIVALIIFLGLTAWDLQLLKTMAQTGDRRLEIVFGVSLFLDFINIFLQILNLIGEKND